MNKQKGFSLLELMIVVVIVGILASIAYPSYQEQVRKTRRADCSGALAGLGNAMERFFTVNSTYLGATTGTNPGPPAIFPATCPSDGSTATYNLTIQVPAGGTTYLLRAAPTGVQANDECGTLTLSNTGAKNVSGQNSGVSWQDCWG